MRKQRSYFFKNLFKATHTKVSKIQGQYIWLQNLFSSIQNAAFDLRYPSDYEPPPLPPKKITTQFLFPLNIHFNESTVLEISILALIPLLPHFHKVKACTIPLTTA